MKLMYKARKIVNKIYCEKCNYIYNSREKYEYHLENHSSVFCEYCPLDVAIQKFVNLFKRK